MKEERPCTRRVLALDANQPLLEVLLPQMNRATACVTVCDCPHPSTPLSCLRRWLHPTVFVKFTLGLALNVSRSGKPNDCFMDASTCLCSGTKQRHTEGVDVTPPVTCFPFFLLPVRARIPEWLNRALKA